MKRHFFIFSLLYAITLVAMEAPEEYLKDIEEFNEQTEDIENIDADRISELISVIREKWGLVKSPELGAKKNY